MSLVAGCSIGTPEGVQIRSSESSSSSGVLTWAPHTLFMSFKSTSHCQVVICKIVLNGQRQFSCVVNIILCSTSSFSWKISPTDPCFNGHELRVGLA